MLPFMNDENGESAAGIFPPESRYHTARVATYESPGGREIRYLRRRFVPPMERFATIDVHLVVEGDRHDLLGHEHLGSSEMSWQICDANGVMKPAELTAHPGRPVRITLPESL